MPATSLGFVTGSETDTPDMVVLDQQLADSINDYMVDGLILPKQVNYQTRTADNTLTCLVGNATHVVSYDGTPYVQGSRITVGGGTFTALDAGRYVWRAQVRVPVDGSSGTAVNSFAVYVETNGTASPYGRNTDTLSRMHTTDIPAGGDLILPSSATVQLVVLSPDIGVSGVIVWSFSLERAG